MEQKEQHVQGAKAGAVLAGTHALVAGLPAMDYWHPSVQEERRKAWASAGSFLARHAYMDALVLQEAKRSG